jgi:peptide/nickel transport system ATP-binding protein
VSSALLQIENLSIGYHTSEGMIQAVTGVSLEVNRGEALGIVGESGSGKSTVAGCILDLLDANASILAGCITFDGIELVRLSKRDRRSLLGKRIGTVFQDPFTSLNPSLKVGAHIAEPLMIHRGMASNAAFGRAVQLLAELGVHNPADVANSYAHQLSGGMKQRAMIAAAIACEPDLLILDEPTTALDVTVEAQLLDTLHDLRFRKNIGIVFISHNLAVVAKLCNRVAVLYAGRLMESGSSESVLETPVHPYAKGLLSSLPRIHELTTLPSAIPGRFPNLLGISHGCIFAPRCPFAAEQCRLAQPLPIPIDRDARRVACIRAPEIALEKWPILSKESPKKMRQPTTTSISAVQSVSKSFVLSRRIRFMPKKRLGGRWLVREVRTVRAVDNVSLNIFAGEVVGLVGESGSGKSTLGRIILRVLEPTNGRVSLAGADITHLSERDLKSRRGFGQMIFQNPDSSLNPRKTVHEILSRPIRMFDVEGSRDINGRIKALLALVQLPPNFASRYPHQLSGGEKQRIGIARALATKPKFIICDESISALDVSVQASIIHLLSDLRVHLGLTILFISHDLSVVATLSDRITVMYRGKVCEAGKTSAVLNPPYHPYTQILLSSLPQLRSQRMAFAKDESGQKTGGGCCFAGRCPSRIEGVCDRFSPPVRSFADGHHIYCHLESADLLNATDLFSLSKKQSS